MSRSQKGKRKVTDNASTSSAEDAPDTQAGLSMKRSCHCSPVRIKQVAMAKLSSKAGSSSKGLASFASLINNANLTAARVETNHGLRSSSSSKSGSSSQSRINKLVFASYFYVHDQI